MKYRGVEGTCHYNKDLKCFVGELKNTQVLITYKGATMKDISRNFKIAVDRYLSMNIEAVKGEIF